VDLIGIETSNGWIRGEAVAEQNARTFSSSKAFKTYRPNLHRFGSSAMEPFLSLAARRFPLSGAFSVESPKVLSDRGSPTYM